MSKVKLGPRALVYPMPVLLIGTVVDGKPNFMTVAWSGICDGDPPMLEIGVRPSRHTLKGIDQNKVFSVNVPSAKQVKEADFCGIESGAEVDKVAICKFKLFYGKSANAPLIEQCPLNLECKVVHRLALGSHIIVIGQIEEVHVSEDCLTDGKPDVRKVRPLIFTPEPSRGYYAFGDFVAQPFKCGLDLRPKK